MKRLLAKRAAQVERHAAQMQALEEKIEQVRARLGRVAKKVA